MYSVVPEKLTASFLKYLDSKDILSADKGDAVEEESLAATLLLRRGLVKAVTLASAINNNASANGDIANADIYLYCNSSFTIILNM